MESQPQNAKVGINPENFHPWVLKKTLKIVSDCVLTRTCAKIMLNTVNSDSVGHILITRNTI